ncbi:MAG: hypothetical protein DHS20C14_17700 [Phycisphaeraceae bacterium]|nr:MAG: hypothetical protein DHS20C14_17700 [Phycisphaeraceae bacterium]
MPAKPARKKTDATDTPEQDPPSGGVLDRRLGLDRRDIEDALGPKPTSGLERRRGPGRRLSDFTKSAEEGEMTPEQFLFLVAIDEFKRVNDKPYPTWTDVLEVIRLLGYRKTQSMELALTRAEDWREPADAPSNVRPDNWSSRPVNPTGKISRMDRDEDEIDFDRLEQELDQLDDLDAAA